MSQITTHILDTSSGSPATGVSVILYKLQSESWSKIAQGTTDSNGRITDFGSDTTTPEAGIYKLEFRSGEYFNRTGAPGFYPFIEISFEIKTDEHYHVPLLLNPFGYTTYRGS
jgi:5-hydroxyisourate hydrolase